MQRSCVHPARGRCLARHSEGGGLATPTEGMRGEGGCGGVCSSRHVPSSSKTTLRYTTNALCAGGGL